MPAVILVSLAIFLFAAGYLLADLVLRKHYEKIFEKYYVKKADLPAGIGRRARPAEAWHAINLSCGANWGNAQADTALSALRSAGWSVSKVGTERAGEVLIRAKFSGGGK